MTRITAVAVRCVAVCLLACAGTLGQTVQFVAGSTTPRIQLTGEHFQIQSAGRYFTDFTPGRTMSRYGVLGTDLGYPIVYPDKILFIFGDTVGTYESGGRHFLSMNREPNGAGDSIGYIPNADLSQCRYIGDVDQQLSQGVAQPNVSAAACPAIRFYANPARQADEHVFKAILISGLQPDESQASFHVPNGGLHYNDRLYLFVTSKIQDASPVARFILQSIVARSDQAPASWSDTNPYTFSRLYTMSSHAAIADPANPPPETGDTGKFMRTPVVTMDAATLASAGITAGLPAALQNVPNVVFVFGTSYRLGRSNLYLAAFSLPDIDAGPSRWSYYRGNGQWSSNERDAVPLLAGTPNIEQHSVIWVGPLRRFMLLRDSLGSFFAQFSTTPWGPWSDSITVFSRNDPWAAKLMNRAGDQIAPTVLPIYRRDGSLAELPNDPGIAYGPNIIDKFTQNSDGSVTVYYTLSTWNPYQAFLMSSTFRMGPATAAAVNAASFDASFSSGAIASLFGSGLADTTAATTSTSLPNTLAGVSVTVRDSAGVSRTAPLFFVSPGQINFLVPTGLASGSATITVTKNSVDVATATIQVSAVAPAIFTANADGRGVAAAYFATVANPTIFAFTCGTTPGSCSPAPFDVAAAQGGAVLVLYGTGLRNHGGLSTVTVTIGGVPGTVVYAGAQNQYPGLDQINVQLPSGLAGRGEVDVVVTVSGRQANTARVAFR